MELHAPPLRRDRAATVSAAPGLLGPILALSLALCAVPATVSAAAPQPDAAPQAPAVAPDPAPGAGDAAPPQQSAPATPEEVAPQPPAANEQLASPATPAPTPQKAQRTTPKSEPKAKPTRARRDTGASRPERSAEPAHPSRLLRVDSLLPGVQGAEESPSHLVLLAAAALLALVMASGSLLSVTTRVWRRPLR